MSCQIYIDNSTGNFFPGNVIQGRVVCTFNSQQEIRGITIKYRGREHTRWTRSESYYDNATKKRRHRTIHYSGDHKFFMNQIRLTGAGKIAPGKFEYPFQFLLPNVCPSSFKTPHGGVSYYLKAEVDIPWSLDYSQEVTFNVVSPIDFNTTPNLMMLPTQYQDEKFVCCCCCASGPITLDVRLDREAYILGEIIRIKAHVLNMTNVNILGLTAKLSRVIKEIATSPRHDSKQTEELLAALHETGVGAHGDRDYDLSLVVPEGTVLPNFALCSLFEQWCTLKVEIELPGCRTNMDVRNSITLGHIPLRGAGFSQTVYVQSSPHQPPPPPVDTYQYPAGGSASAPYSTGSNGKDLPGVHMPMPMPGGIPSAPYPLEAGPSTQWSPQPTANAPPKEGAPSAPTKAPFVDDDDDWNSLHGSSVRPGPSEQPPARELPPTYHEAIGQDGFPRAPK